MRWFVILATTAILLAPVVPVAAAPPASPAAVVPDPASSPDVPGPGALDLSIRARSLGLTPGASGDPTLGLGTMRAPTGAGSSRWPSNVSELAPGLYLHM